MASTLESSMNRISLLEFELDNTSTYLHSADRKRRSGRWSAVADFKEKLRVRIVSRSDGGMELEFDLVGPDPSLANAFRRILLSDVPAMAIEKVYIYNNTSIIQDEVLAHRLGLIPLRADARLFEWKQPGQSDEGDEKNTLEFDLKIRCRRNPVAPKVESGAAENPDDAYLDHKVFTSSITWVARAGQAALLGADVDPGPVQDDILVAKLRPGHELDVKLFAVKGVGRDHAKFSPVATTFYRLLPEIKLKRDVFGEAAERLQKCFSPGVIALVKAEDSKDFSRVKAVVADARNDSGSRNVFRHEDLKDAVELLKVKDHFIFTIESVGAQPAEDLFLQAVDILSEKCDFFLKELEIVAH